MPKEYVRTASPTEFDVSVGWERDREVQIGVVMPPTLSLLTRLLSPGSVSDEDAARIGRDLLYGLSVTGLLAVDPDDVLPADHRLIPAGRAAIQATSSQHPAAAFDGVYSTLNRREINELIRNLRRARDAAYGRDE